MSLSPGVNRSFLHGSQRSFAIMEKIINTTVDSLALKGARLPLQLLPVDEDNDDAIEARTEKTNAAEKKVVAEKTFSKETSSKVECSPNLSPERLLNLEAVDERTNRSNDLTKTIDEDKIVEKRVAISKKLQNDDVEVETTDVEDVETIEAPGGKSSGSEVVEARNVECFPRRSLGSDTSSSSSDYEIIEPGCCSPNSISSEKDASKDISEDRRKSSRIDCRKTVDNSIENEVLCGRRDFYQRSYSIGNLTTNEAVDFPKERTLFDKIEIDRTNNNEWTSRDERKSNVQRKLSSGHFAKNVLHYVPGYLVRRSKKQTKKRKKYALSSSLSSLKSIHVDTKLNPDLCRSRSLSRDELKYVTISTPSNFVHVASATNPKLVSNENSVKSNLGQLVITHAEKRANLPLLVGKEYDDVENGSANQTKDSAEVGSMKEPSTTFVTERSPDDIPNEGDKIIDPKAPTSFLWKNESKSLLRSNRSELPCDSLRNIDETTEETEDYDDIGPISNGAIEECDYDDVGPPLTRYDENRAADLISNSDEIYDDVVSPSCDREDDDSALHRERGGDFSSGRATADTGQKFALEPETLETAESTELEDKNHYFAINNDYSSVEDDGDSKGDADEQGVYDDVAFPSKEHVNSLYGYSSVLRSAENEKESEWEDLEDSTTAVSTYPRRSSDSREKNPDVQSISSKKKLLQRSSRKMKRQRSRMSKRSSKSFCQSTDNSAIYVAVSLGSGSVLLVSSLQKAEEERSKNPLVQEFDRYFHVRTQGLVQMRLVDFDEDTDTQETSCYVYEDNTTEDGTIENAYSYQIDDFSSDSEMEMTEVEEQTHDTTEKSYDRAVNNFCEVPINPIPTSRESSLTQTLGRRIKILRRTWSITKCSLNRIRRRTSADEEHASEENKQISSAYQATDDGKYFSFRKHFRKNFTSLSKFYLNNGSDICDTKSNNNNFTKERIYANSNWYASSVKESASINPSQIYKNESAFPVNNYSILADQEPLYQFYTAATTRVAFGSDSDGYEEVGDLNSSPTTIDLAHSGHRTLWCQTPQVIHSGLLEKLTVEEKRIQEAKFEILTSEASYLNSLRVLENEFLNNHELVNNILSSSEKDKLFGGVPGALQVSQAFLTDLESVWKEDITLLSLPDVLLKYAEKSLHIFVGYCSNQVKIDMTLKELRAQKNSKFAETISNIQMHPACQSLSLHSFLMLPMQRVTRLPLLVDAVLSKLSMEHADRPLWEKVLSNFSHVVTECNEGARVAAQETEMEVLTRKLEYSSKIRPIVPKSRHLVKSGLLVQLSTKADMERKLTFGKKFNKTPLYLFLLSDYLLIAKLKSNTHDETYTVIDTCKRSLIALEPVLEDSPFAGRNAMILTLLENHCGNQVEYVFTCESDTERERWLEAVSQPKRGLVGETLYETWDCPQVIALYSYTPNQSDELLLQPGDVINVLKKMADGWYYGEKLLNSEQGWFPGNYTKEVVSEHVRARNLKQRHRLLALSGSVLQRRARQNLTVH